MKSMLKRFWNDEAGMELVEYAIMAGLIVVGVIAIIAAIGTKVNTRFNSLNNALQ